MEQKYLDLAREYIASHPEYLNDPDQLAFQLKIIGVPKDKIKGLVKDATKRTPQSIQPQSEVPPQASNSSSKKIVVFFLFYLVLITGMVLFIIFAPSKKKKEITYVIPKPVAQTHVFLPQTPAGGIVRKVYANELPVKMEQVFSYPVKNISLGPTVRPKRDVVGFIPYWASDSLDKLDVSEITTANIFGLEPDGQGNIVITDSQGQADKGWAMWNDPRLSTFLSTLKQKQVKTNIVIKMFSNPRIEALLSSSDAQQKLISNIMYMVGAKNLDGVNLDFEYVGDTPQSVRNGFTNFASNLHSELVKEYPTATLSIDTYASSGINSDLFDLSTLSHVTESFIIMGYDFHTPYTSPGPVAPLTGEQSVVSYLANYLQKVPADKVILGVPYYGYDWDVTDPSPDSTTILSYADISNVSSLTSLQWDSASETPWYQYNDAQGKIHKVYFDNVRSLGLKYDLVNERNLKGIGVWAVGYEGGHPELNQLISQKFGY